MHTFPYIDFDSAKAQSNLRKHKVSFAQAIETLRDVYAMTVEDDSAAGEQRFVTIGMDADARILVIVHIPRGDRTRLISARKASRGEARQYHAQGIRF